jgi:transposase InsO family protein
MSRPYTPKTNGKAERFIQTALREALLVGWYDLMLASKKLPIQAQVFQSWYFALHPDKLSSLDAVHGQWRIPRPERRPHAPGR